MSDPLPFHARAKLFAQQMGGRTPAAAALLTPRSTYDKWCDGKHMPQQEGAIRLLMDMLLDRRRRRGDPDAAPGRARVIGPAG